MANVVGNVKHKLGGGFAFSYITDSLGVVNDHTILQIDYLGQIVHKLAFLDVHIAQRHSIFHVHSAGNRRTRNERCRYDENVFDLSQLVLSNRSATYCGGVLHPLFKGIDISFDTID